MIAKQRARLTRPGVVNHQVTFGCALKLIAFVVHQRRLHAEEGFGSGARFQLGGTRQRCDHEAAGFGLPPGINNRAATVANLFVIPLPGFRIDRFTYGTHNAQTAASGAFNGPVAFRHQRANSGGCSVEQGHVVLVDDLRHPARFRPVGHPFKHQRGGATGQRAIEQIAVTGDPADIGGAPVNVVVMVIKNILKGAGGIDQIAAGGMQYAFWLPGRTGGIQNKQRVFRFNRHRFMLCAGLADKIVPPEIASLVPRRGFSGALKYDHILHAGHQRISQRVIDILFQRNGASGADTLIRCDHQLRVAVDHATRHGFRRKTAENHRVHGTNARAGQHRHGCLRHHRHINGHHIAFFNLKLR